MLTSISFENGQIFAHLLEVDAASGDVLLGEASEEEIRDYANATWAAPYDGHGDYNTMHIEWV